MFLSPVRTLSASIPLVSVSYSSFSLCTFLNPFLQNVTASDPKLGQAPQRQLCRDQSAESQFEVRRVSVKYTRSTYYIARHYR